jgi:L-amino acid N-acyltransferase YncA
MLADSSVPAPKGPDAIYTILGVHTQWRGRGNGGRLVDYLAARIFDAGAARITGLIRTDNLASLSLHKRLGWNIKKISTEHVKVWIDRPDTNS